VWATSGAGTGCGIGAA